MVGDAGDSWNPKSAEIREKLLDTLQEWNEVLNRDCPPIREPSP